MLYDEKKPAGEQLGAPDTVFKGIPKGYIHNGGRIAFGPDKMLYAGTGESGDTRPGPGQEVAGRQDPAPDPGGRTGPGQPVRRTPPSTPTATAMCRASPGTPSKRLFASEFGQDTWDELNAIKPGDNYGWPDAEGKVDDAEFHNPVAQWHTDDASPSGIAYAEGSVWMAGLQRPAPVAHPAEGHEGLGRPAGLPRRASTAGCARWSPAGGDKLWLVTSNTDGRGNPKSGDDRILELQVK